MCKFIGEVSRCGKRRMGLNPCQKEMAEILGVDPVKHGFLPGTWPACHPPASATLAG